MYADDTALICAHESIAEAFRAANEEMKLICNWFNSNKLLLNVNKTKYMVIHSSYKAVALDSCVLLAEGQPVERVSNLTYLGVVLDHQFNWKMHIDYLCKKLGPVCFTLLKCRHFFDEATLRTIYFVLFHSQLSYCIESWGHTYDSYIKPLVVLQKRVIRFLSNSNYATSTKPLFSQYQIMPLHLLINYKTTIMVYSSLNNNVPLHCSNFLPSQFKTRGHECGNFLKPLVKNAYGKRRLSSIGTSLWTNLPVHVKQHRAFFTMLKRYYKELY